MARKPKMAVKVYIDFVNHWDETTDSALIAEFAHIEWARRFVADVKERIEDEVTRIRVEEV